MIIAKKGAGVKMRKNIFEYLKMISSKASSKNFKDVEDSLFDQYRIFIIKQFYEVVNDINVTENFNVDFFETIIDIFEFIIENGRYPKMSIYESKKSIFIKNIISRYRNKSDEERKSFYKYFWIEKLPYWRWDCHPGDWMNHSLKEKFFKNWIEENKRLPIPSIDGNAFYMKYRRHLESSEKYIG